MKGRLACLAGLSLGCAAWCAETLWPAEVREAAVETTPRIERLAHDSAGLIWGISRDEAGKIYSRGEHGWNAVSVASLESFRPQAIDVTTEGVVICLWLSPDGSLGALSRHPGTEESHVATFAGKLNEPRLFVCQDGSATVTERGPTVVVFNADENTAQVRKLPDTLFRPAIRGDAQERNYAPIRAVQDEENRRWLWSFALDPSDYQWRIAGLVVMREDGSFENFSAAGLTQDDLFSDVLPIGPDELWLARVGDGLWSLNTETRQAAPLAEANFPEVPLDAFRFIEEMRVIDGTRFVVTCPRPNAVDASGGNGPRIAGRIALSIRYFYNRAKRTGGLFRYRNGKWEKLLDNLDESPRFGSWQRPWAQNAEALFIGANGSGPWILPKDANISPVLLDWRQHFPLNDAVDFSLTAEGDLLCVSSSGETTLASSKPDRRRRIREVDVLRTGKRLWRDSRGHLWGIDNPMREWDGGKWIARPLPPEVAEQSVSEWLADDRDRGWIVFSSGRVAVCDFATAKWQVFETVESALQAQLPAGVHLPNLDNPFLDPAYSTDGRCVIFRLPDRLSYFDGSAWCHWTVREIGGDAATVDGGPYFDQSGKLCFPLSGHVHQWDVEVEKWNAFSDPLGPKPSTRPVEPSTEQTQPSPVKDPASVARDANGIDWIVTRDGELKKLAPGVLISAFFQGEPHPFRKGMKVARALVDPAGNAWLELADSWNFQRYIFIQGFLPPDTKIDLRRIEGDTAELRFTVPNDDVAKKEGAPPSPFFSWQLDGGPWQRLSTKPDLTLTHLSAGRHRLLVRSFDAGLAVDPTPAVIEWETRIDPEQQHRTLLNELSAPTLARREAAAKSFRDQGAAVISFLETARSSASEETRWWIDAILQQIASKH